MRDRASWQPLMLVAAGVVFLYAGASLVADEAGQPKVLFSKTQTSVPVAGHEDYLSGTIDLKTGPGVVMQPYGFVQGAKWLGELVIFPQTAIKRHTFYLYKINELTQEDALSIAKYAKSHSGDVMVAIVQPSHDQSKYVGTPVKWNNDFLYALAAMTGVQDVERFWKDLGLDVEEIPGLIVSDEFLSDDPLSDIAIIRSVLDNSEKQTFECIGCMEGGYLSKTKLRYDDFGLVKAGGLVGDALLEGQQFYFAANARIEGADHALVGKVVSDPLQPSPGVDIGWPVDD